LWSWYSVTLDRLKLLFLHQLTSWQMNDLINIDDFNRFDLNEGHDYRDMDLHYVKLCWSTSLSHHRLTFWVRHVLLSVGHFHQSQLNQSRNCSGWRNRDSVTLRCLTLLFIHPLRSWPRDVVLRADLFHWSHLNLNQDRMKSVQQLSFK
jgi:hypothetical protein